MGLHLPLELVDGDDVRAHQGCSTEDTGEGRNAHCPQELIRLLELSEAAELGGQLRSNSPYLLKPTAFPQLTQQESLPIPQTPRCR